MWDFDGDESAFLLVAGFAAFILIRRYFREMRTVSVLVCPLQRRLPLVVLPIVCLFIVYVVLDNWSDPQTVRGHADYMTLFMVGGALWVFGSAAVMRLLGISARDDAIERHNAAATSVAVGAMVGNTCCYAGSNIGAGPTIWTTILPAVIANGTLFFLWLAIELATHVSEEITVGRHLPSGLALSGFLIASGADLGWAMSGDWQSWPATMADFLRRGWPAIIFAAAAILAIQIWKPRCRLAPS